MQIILDSEVQLLQETHTHTVSGRISQEQQNGKNGERSTPPVLKNFQSRTRKERRERGKMTVCLREQSAHVLLKVK